MIRLKVVSYGRAALSCPICTYPAAFNVPVCPHFLMELHVSLVCAVQNAPTLEFIPQVDEITTAPMEIRDGQAVAPETPGQGIAWESGSRPDAANPPCREKGVGRPKMNYRTDS